MFRLQMLKPRAFVSSAGATLFAFLFLWCFVVILPTNAGGV